LKPLDCGVRHNEIRRIFRLFTCVHQISAAKSGAISPGSALDKNGFVNNDKFTGKDHNPYFHRWQDTVYF
jgi:hypothetical protein